MSIQILPNPTERTGIAVPKHEKSIHDAVARIASDIRRGQRGTTIVAYELTLPPRRPDIVVATVDLAAWKVRKRRGVAPCTAPALVRILAKVIDSGGSMPFDRLRRPSRGNIEPLDASIGKLIKLGHITRDPSNLISLSSALELHLFDSVGVEAKLTSPSAARRQALDWLRYVDGAYIAMPEREILKIPRSDEHFRRLGLIASQDNGKDCVATIVRRPRFRKPTTAARLITQEQLFARWLMS